MMPIAETDREWIEERAAILEFDAGLLRSQADAEALRMWRDYVAQRQEQ